MFTFQYNYLCCTDNLKTAEIKENTLDPVISENNISEIKITGDLVQLNNRLPVWPCQPRTGADVRGAKDLDVYAVISLVVISCWLILSLGHTDGRVWATVAGISRRWLL